MKEMYIALTAARTQEQHLSVVASNLANVNSAGFKKQTAVFQVRPPQVDYPRLEQSVSPDLNLPPARQSLDGNQNYVRLAASTFDFSSGALRVTGNPFDMALQDGSPGGGTTALFAVSTPQGVRYTRAGNFTLNAAGEMVTAGGHPVLSSAGTPIRVEDGVPEVSAAGELRADGKDLGSLRIVVFDHPEALVPMGHSLFADIEGAAGARAADASDGVAVRSGCLESSNVNVVEELVRMIELERAYGAIEKSVETIDNASSRATSLVLNA